MNLQLLWKNRDFMLLSSGQLVSWVGTQISSIALPLVVLALTGSPAQAGSIAAMRGFIYVLLALPAGALVDRWDRRKVMLVANLGSGLAMGSVSFGLWFHWITIPWLYLIGAIEGSFFVFANLARFTSTPFLVKREELPLASTQMNLADFLALSFGPGLGGLLYQTVGAFFSFFVDSLSYFFNAVFVFFISTPLTVQNKEKPNLRKEMIEGATWLWRQESVRFLNIVTVVVTVVAVGLYLLIVVMAKSYHASSVIIGAILGMGAVGGIVGSLITPWIHHHFTFRKILIGTIVAYTFVFGLYFFVSSIFFLTVVTILLSAIMPVYDIAAFSYSAGVIPDRIRGRVSSFGRICVMGADSLGYFFMGLSLQYLGVHKSIVVFWLLLFVIVVLVILQKSFKNT